MRLVLLLALATLAVALSVSAQSVNWVQYINPIDRDDGAGGVCLFGEYLAVIGEANDRYFAALLDRATGEVVKTWVGKFIGWFKDCLSVGCTQWGGYIWFATASVGGSGLRRGRWT